MEKITVCLKMWLFILCCFAIFAFKATDLLNDQAIFVQKKLADHYDGLQEAFGLKRGELTVTNSGFCRYKRYFENGKIEYFSFNLIKYRDFDFLGTVKSGKLRIYTMSDDVIVQTYNDKAGDLDSMASSMTIPLKNIEPEDLADFSKSFQLMHAALKK